MRCETGDLRRETKDTRLKTLTSLRDLSQEPGTKNRIGDLPLTFHLLPLTTLPELPVAYFLPRTSYFQTSHFQTSHLPNLQLPLRQSSLLFFGWFFLVLLDITELSCIHSLKNLGSLFGRKVHFLEFLLHFFECFFSVA